MVLEARKDAEVIGYPVVGEDGKTPSNIIDYNINKEITIDQSSVPNWNNDTTTGMANVIPGINAPKLIPDTSLYKPIIVERGPDVTVSGTTYSSSSKFQFNNLTYTVTGDLDYGNNTGYIRIPISGLYRMHVKGYDQWYPGYSVPSEYAYYFIEAFGLSVQEKITSGHLFEYDEKIYFEAGTQIKFYVQNTSGASMQYFIDVTMTKQ